MLRHSKQRCFVVVGAQEVREKKEKVRGKNKTQRTFFGANFTVFLITNTVHTVPR
jgi:hypothetical protein